MQGAKVHPTHPHVQLFCKAFPLPAYGDCQSHAQQQVVLHFVLLNVLQGLADLDPDMDAVWRLTRPEEIAKVGRLVGIGMECGRPVQLGQLGSWAYKECLPLAPAGPFPAAEAGGGIRRWHLLPLQQPEHRVLEVITLAAAACISAGRRALCLWELVFQQGNRSTESQHWALHACRSAFWALFLPTTVTLRVADIWRSYWAQRLMWEV